MYFLTTGRPVTKRYTRYLGRYLSNSARYHGNSARVIMATDHVLVNMVKGMTPGRAMEMTPVPVSVGLSRKALWGQGQVGTGHLSDNRRLLHFVLLLWEYETLTLYWLNAGPTSATPAFQCGDRVQTSESDVCRRQILTSKVDPSTERIKICMIVVDL